MTLLTKEKMVFNKDIKLWTESFGDTKNPAVLLIAGSAASCLIWPQGFCERLCEKNFFVIRYDHRDTGLSAHLPESSDGSPVYDINTLIEDVLTILNAYQIDKAHLIGHSMGGFMVELMAISNSDRLLSGTIISAGPTINPEIVKSLKLPPLGQEPQPSRDKTIEKPMNGAIEHDLPIWLPRWKQMNGSVMFDVKMAEALTRGFYKRNAYDAMHCQNQMAADQTVPDDLIDNLKKIHSPILILHGTEDPLIPFAHGQKLAEMIPGAHFKALPKAGHMFFAETIWGTILDNILSFLKYDFL